MFEQLRADDLTAGRLGVGVNTPPPEYVAPPWAGTDAADGVTGHVFRRVARSARGTATVERTIYRGDHRTNPP
jgi:hypothetical protein